MKLLINLLCILIGMTTVQAQYCTPNNRFTEEAVFSNSQIIETSGVVYGNAPDRFGVPEDLIMDIFEPDQSIDPLPIRPFVLLIHPGGFQSGNKDVMRDACIFFAQRGYVAATISYRLGWDTSDPSDQLNAVYRANQDARAAMRFIVHNASDYNIDPDFLFIGGRSAGAVSSLTLAYISQDEWNSYIPNIETELGGLDTSGNPLTETYDIQAIFNNWGATFGNFVTTDELIPTVAFHGAMDPTVPIDMDPVTGFAGSRYLHDLMVSAGICSSLTVDPNGGHGIYLDLAGKEFRVSTASCFFKSLMCDSCSTLYTEEPITPNCSETLEVTSNNLELIKIYPNPFTDQINISSDNQLLESELIDVQGKVQFKGLYINQQDFSRLSPGVYFIKISDQNSQIIKALIKR